jgi:hypothetical protein
MTRREDFKPMEIVVTRVRGDAITLAISHRPS